MKEIFNVECKKRSKGRRCLQYRFSWYDQYMYAGNYQHNNSSLDTAPMCVQRILTKRFTRQILYYIVGTKNNSLHRYCLRNHPFPHLVDLFVVWHASYQPSRHWRL